MTYRRLNHDEGPFRSLSMLARAVAGQMLRLSDANGHIEFLKPIAGKELAAEIGKRLGRDRSDSRVLPRLMDEIMSAGMWQWSQDDGRCTLTPSPWVMTPGKQFKTARRKKTNALSPSSVPSESSLSTSSVRSESTVIPGGPAKPPKPLRCPPPNVDNNKIDSIDRGWLAAAKIIKSMFEAETGRAWMEHGKQQQLTAIWLYAVRQGEMTQRKPEDLLPEIVDRWLKNDWVASNGFPLGNLARQMDKYAAPSKTEKIDRSEQISILRNKRRELLMADLVEEAERVSDEIRRLS